jgi:hypothetical protein
VQLNVAGQNQQKHKTTFPQTTQNDDTEEMPLQIPICQCLKQRAQEQYLCADRQQTEEGRQLSGQSKQHKH